MSCWKQGVSAFSDGSRVSLVTHFIRHVISLCNMIYVPRFEAEFMGILPHELR